VDIITCHQVILSQKSTLKTYKSFLGKLLLYRTLLTPTTSVRLLITAILFVLLKNQPLALPRTRVDQANYFQFAVDDIEAKVAHINWTDMAIGSAAYSLRNNFDSSVLSYMRGQAGSGNIIGSDSASSTGDITSTSAAMDLGYGAGEVSPLRMMARARRQLNDQDAPEDNRWFVAPPDFWEIMEDENSKLLDRDFTNDSDSKLRNGRVTEGLIRGFRCYMSRNLPAASSATNSILFGHMSSTATASQIAKTEVLRSEDFFGDKTRGLHLFGRKALRTETLGTGYYVID
jgi:hypothetical protein